MSDEEPKKDKDENEKKLTPVRSKAPVRADITSIGLEADLISKALPVEIGQAGIRLGAKSEKSLKDGEAVNVISANGTDFGIVDRRYLVKRLPDGKLELSPMGDPLGPQEVRDDLARQIMNANRKVIREEVMSAVETALQRKDIPTLQNLKEASDAGRKVHVTSERGCMYLTIGRRSTLL